MLIKIPLYNLFSQNIQPKPSSQSSLEAFSNGDYEKALMGFSELLKTYPKDPLYKYYSGVCLIKLNRDPDEAENLLHQALQGAGSVKTLPSDELFYLGRAQQMSGKFSEASESYNLFTNQAGKKAAKDLNIPEYLQQCAQNKGQAADSEIKIVDIVENEKADTGAATNKLAVTAPVLKTAEKNNFAITNLPVNYEKILEEAVNLQFKADSLTATANKQKKELENLSFTQKSALMVKITDNEKLAASLQNSADKKYLEAQDLMNPPRDSSLHSKKAATTGVNKIVTDTSGKKINNTVKISDKQQDTAKATASALKTKVEIFSVFEVLTKPVTDPEEKIKIDPVVPAGLIYCIQIAVFRNLVALSYFRGITPVYGFKIAGTDKTTYYAGIFRKSADVTRALTAVKEKGLKDAFVVAMMEKKPVSADRAVVMEKEWGKRPLFMQDGSLNQNQVDTVPPALSFRAEVTRSQKPLKDDIVEGIRKMAGNRRMDIQQVESGKIVYLIGKFITFETAAEYVDLLMRNGYRDAKVVAWLGKKEVPIETAKQLFDNLK